MTRLIDADTLSEKLCETTIFIKDGEVFQRMINDAPTVDAVEVVRCKDCIYYSNGECQSGTLPFSEYSDLANAWLTPRPNDYCSYGERSEPWKTL